MPSTSDIVLAIERRRRALVSDWRDGLVIVVHADREGRLHSVRILLIEDFVRDRDAAGIRHGAATNAGLGFVFGRTPRISGRARRERGAQVLVDRISLARKLRRQR